MTPQRDLLIQEAVHILEELEASMPYSLEVKQLEIEYLKNDKNELKRKVADLEWDNRKLHQEVNSLKHEIDSLKRRR